MIHVIGDREWSLFFPSTRVLRDRVSLKPSSKRGECEDALEGVARKHRERLISMDTWQLRSLCLTHNLDVLGSRVDLEERLLLKLVCGRREGRIGDILQKIYGLKRKKQPGRKRKDEQSIDGDPLLFLKKKELIKLCETRSLDSSGKKPGLVDRLRAFHRKRKNIETHSNDSNLFKRKTKKKKKKITRVEKDDVEESPMDDNDSDFEEGEVVDDEEDSLSASTASSSLVDSDYEYPCGESRNAEYDDEESYRFLQHRAQNLLNRLCGASWVDAQVPQTLTPSSSSVTSVLNPSSGKRSKSKELLPGFPQHPMIDAFQAMYTVTVAKSASQDALKGLRKRYSKRQEQHPLNTDLEIVIGLFEREANGVGYPSLSWHKDDLRTYCLERKIIVQKEPEQILNSIAIRAKAEARIISRNTRANREFSQVWHDYPPHIQDFPLRLANVQFAENIVESSGRVSVTALSSQVDGVEIMPLPSLEKLFEVELGWRIVRGKADPLEMSARWYHAHLHFFGFENLVRAGESDVGKLSEALFRVLLLGFCNEPCAKIQAKLHELKSRLVMKARAQARKSQEQLEPMPKRRERNIMKIRNQVLHDHRLRQISSLEAEEIHDANDSFAFMIDPNQSDEAHKADVETEDLRPKQEEEEVGNSSSEPSIKLERFLTLDLPTLKRPSNLTPNLAQEIAKNILIL